MLLEASDGVCDQAHHSDVFVPPLIKRLAKNEVESITILVDIAKQWLGL